MAANTRCAASPPNWHIECVAPGPPPKRRGGRRELAALRPGPLRKPFPTAAVLATFGAVLLLPQISAAMARIKERRSLPPLNALRAFEAVARSLSFTRAAEELLVTQ